MKIKGAIVINNTMQKVTDFFADPKYLKEYQDGFISKKLVKGIEGTEGAESLMLYKNGKHSIELLETITKNELPHTFEAHYHHKHMDNTMTCHFIALDENTTRYEYEYEYTRINWVMPKLIAILFPNLYKRPAEKWLRQFKAFVEKQ